MSMPIIALSMEILVKVKHSSLLLHTIAIPDQLLLEEPLSYESLEAGYFIFICEVDLWHTSLSLLYLLSLS